MYILLGSSGYIGSAFEKELLSRELPYVSLSRSNVDYTDYEEFCNYLDINWVNFSKGAVVVNCAGYTGKPNVDACERNKDKAILGNVVLPSMLSGVCRSRGIRLVHISSGCIYDGFDHPFSEEDAPNFDFNTGSFYSGTKELAERSVKDNPLAYIFRLRIPFDHESSPRNYITKLLTYDTLVDVRNSLSHRYDFVKYCVDLVEQKAPFGIYNITNKGSVTTREVVDLIKHLTSVKAFKFFGDYGQFERMVLTPRSNCVLNTSKLENYTEVRSVQDALSDALSHYTIPNEVSSNR